MIYKSEFPVLKFEVIRDKQNETIDYMSMSVIDFVDSLHYGFDNLEFMIQGLAIDTWPVGVRNDPAIVGKNRDVHLNLKTTISCLNDDSDKSNFVKIRHTLSDGAKYAFIRLSPGRWLSMELQIFNLFYRYTGKSVDELPVYIAYADPVSSDEDSTVIRSIFNASKSFTINTWEANLLFPGQASAHDVYQYTTQQVKYGRVANHLYPIFVKDELGIFGHVCIKGKFGVFKSNSIFVWIGVINNKPYIEVIDGDAFDIDDFDRLIYKAESTARVFDLRTKDEPIQETKELPGVVEAIEATGEVIETADSSNVGFFFQD